MADYSAYTKRNDLLRSWGYDSYAHYRESPLWKGIRKRVLARDGCICASCGKRDSFIVHHRSYDAETLAGSSLRMLQTLCKPCHDLAEIDNGNKRTLRAANGIISDSREACNHRPKRLVKTKRCWSTKCIKCKIQKLTQKKQSKGVLICKRCQPVLAKPQFRRYV